MNMGERPKRKLLTILAADIAGYSRAMSQSEEIAIAQLGELRLILDEVIATNSGRIANTAGDSVIACFESVIDGVRAAVEIQRRHDKYHDEKMREIRMRFRIGLNLGDVVIQKNGDALGNGVNIAARLEAIAEPGGICLSENIIEHVRGRLDYQFTQIGEHFLKNIQAPVKVYALGQRKVGMSQRVSNLFEKTVRHPFAIGVAVASVLASLAMSLFSFGSREVSKPDLPLTSFLETNPTPDALLSFFDLVTEGTFEGSKYYIIRTWGGSLSDLIKIGEILGGHLVAINSAEENAFLFELSVRDEGHWQVVDGQYNGPTIGLVQEDGAEEPAGGWYWLNGDPVDYLNWKPYGPENYQGDQSLAHFKTNMGPAPSPYWNDMRPVMHSSIFEVPGG